MDDDSKLSNKALTITTVMDAIKRIEVLRMHYMQFFFAGQARRTFVQLFREPDRRSLFQCQILAEQRRSKSTNHVRALRIEQGLFDLFLEYLSYTRVVSHTPGKHEG